MSELPTVYEGALPPGKREAPVKNPCDPFDNWEMLHARLTDGIPAAPVVLQSVCAWHTPKPELDRLNRAFPGQISHSMCAACRVLFEAGEAI